MVEEPTDWKVEITLDRGALAKDINTLVHILARQRVFCIVSAGNSEEAVGKTKEHLIQHGEVPLCYVKAMTPRRLPT